MPGRLHDLILGPAKDPLNPRTVHTLTLAAFFAWVGLGADGLSSSCYGPEQAYSQLLQHKVLAIPLALLMGLTVFAISGSYSQLIELFPSGGGGYLATTKLLGRGPGVVCGCALVLDYILTIAISIASGIEAIFSYLPSLDFYRVPAMIAMLLILIMLNVRGVKESVIILLPIFVVFLLTHVFGLITVFVTNHDHIQHLVATTPQQLTDSASKAGGWLPLLAIFLAAYSIGGGTYTGIEAVSNSLQILREPRVSTGKRTMLYMAISLAVTASGLLFCYLLADVSRESGKTLNAVLFEKSFAIFSTPSLNIGYGMALVTLLSEGALLFVAAQAGFIGGPRTLATMALDRWVPARFSHLSSRLVVQDGVLFMGIAAGVFIIATGGHVDLLVILYSINVFITFSLSQLGMCLHWVRSRKTINKWGWKFLLNAQGLVLTSMVLVMMIYFKFLDGAWVTLLITGIAVGVCYLVNAHYARIRSELAELDFLVRLPPEPGPVARAERSPGGPTAVLLVGGYNGLGIHTFLTVLRLFPNHFKNFIFVSVGVVDFAEFKGQEELENLRRRTVGSLDQFVARALSMGIYAEHRHAIGTDLVDEVEEIAARIAKEYPSAIYFGGQLLFANENFLNRSLHSQAAFEIQRRLQFNGWPMVLLTIRVRSLGARAEDAAAGGK